MSGNANLKFCQACGGTIAESDRFCGGCGVGLSPRHKSIRARWASMTSTKRRWLTASSVVILVSICGGVGALPTALKTRAKHLAEVQALRDASAREALYYAAAKPVNPSLSTENWMKIHEGEMLVPGLKVGMSIQEARAAFPGFHEKFQPISIDSNNSSILLIGPGQSIRIGFFQGRLHDARFLLRPGQKHPSGTRKAGLKNHS